MRNPLPATIEEAAILIDHTILKPGATRDQVITVADEGRKWNCASVCIHPVWVRDVANILAGSRVGVCTVIGFPHGATTPEALAAESVRARNDGATELDMVIPYGQLRSGNVERVRENVLAVRQAAGNAVVKAILEISELDEAQLRTAAEVALEAGADFLKTSTGFASGGATVEAVRLLSDIAKGSAGIKASGGIRTFDDMKRMLEAGATRIGASSTIAILEQARQELNQ